MRNNRTGHLVKTNPILRWFDRAHRRLGSGQVKTNFKGKKMLLCFTVNGGSRAFLPSHYLVEFCRGDDRMSLFKMQGYESCV